MKAAASPGMNPAVVPERIRSSCIKAWRRSAESKLSYPTHAAGRRSP
jgi:hypothetical protein